MSEGLKYALSKNIVLVSSVTPEFSPPNTPAMHMGLFSPSQIIKSSSLSFLSIPSRVINFSFLLPYLTIIFSLETFSKSKA